MSVLIVVCFGNVNLCLPSKFVKFANNGLSAVFHRTAGEHKLKSGLFRKTKM